MNMFNYVAPMFVLQARAKNNPACIIRSSYDNEAFIVVMRKRGHYEPISSELSFEEASAFCIAVNQEKQEN